MLPCWAKTRSARKPAQSVCKNLLTRKGVHELAAARDKRILLLSASLLDTPQLQTAAAVCLAQAMYPDLFADVDAAQAVRQLADESGRLLRRRVVLRAIIFDKGGFNPCAKKTRLCAC